MHIPTVHSDRTFKFARAEYYQPFIYVGEGGDLTLNLEDAPRLDELAEEGLIEHWADEAEFLLEGPDLLDGATLNFIDEREALEHVWTRLVLPASAQLLDDEVDKRGLGAGAGQGTLSLVRLPTNGAFQRREPAG